MFLEFIALFMPPAFVVMLYYINKKEGSTQQKLFTFISILLITNIIIALILIYFRNRTHLDFNLLFFIKYVGLNLVLSTITLYLMIICVKYSHFFKLLTKKTNRIEIGFAIFGIVLFGLGLSNLTKQVTFYEKLNLIKIDSSDELIVFNIDTLGYDLPETKAEGELDVKISLGTQTQQIETYGTIKIQGTTTQLWPKKNWSLKLYSDIHKTNELLLQVGNSIPSNKWILKADWIDPSMYRNGVSYMLWDQIVGSRNNKYLEINNSSINNSGATGSPRYYSGMVKINGEHYGLTTLLLGHDIDNFNIDKNNSNHLYFEFDARGGYTLEKTWKKFKSDGIGEWIEFYNLSNEDITSPQKEAIDRFGSFLNSNYTNF